MKILCIFLIFIFTISCGPSGKQEKKQEELKKEKDNVTLFVVLARLHATPGNTYLLTAIRSPAVLYGNT
ncbi:hypothetical protein E2I00_005768 [Balaenoptera physalus]|uniref:Lipoprotein n=1 Tax=Balaenoptera physalus TaxID=9770 RepID=A0A643BUC2_BALPH|nr:hypothetical protein E2I00_005768 [Balaenoptera physalus]